MIDKPGTPVRIITKELTIFKSASIFVAAGAEYTSLPELETELARQNLPLDPNDRTPGDNLALLCNTKDFELHWSLTPTGGSTDDYVIKISVHEGLYPGVGINGYSQTHGVLTQDNFGHMPFHVGNRYGRVVVGYDSASSGTAAALSGYVRLVGRIK